ncbi:hypothetical protein [Salmon gill poxvirus]
MLVEHVEFPGLIRSGISTNVLNNTEIVVFGPVKNIFVQGLIKSVLYRVNKHVHTFIETHGEVNYYKKIKMLVIDVLTHKQWILINYLIPKLPNIKLILSLIPSVQHRGNLSPRYNPVKVRKELSRVFILHDRITEFTDFSDFHFGIVDSWIMDRHCTDTPCMHRPCIHGPTREPVILFDRAKDIVRTGQGMYRLGLYVGVGAQFKLFQNKPEVPVKLSDFTFGPGIFPENNSVLDKNKSVPEVNDFIKMVDPGDPEFLEKMGSLFSVVGSYLSYEDNMTDLFTPDFWRWKFVLDRVMTSEVFNEK